MFGFGTGSEFENDVKMYGTETEDGQDIDEDKFENDVKTYGTETCDTEYTVEGLFENDVKTYGTETRCGRML